MRKTTVMRIITTKMPQGMLARAEKMVKKMMKRITMLSMVRKTTTMAMMMTRETPMKMAGSAREANEMIELLRWWCGGCSLLSCLH